jgi:hypothetical protein
MLKKLIIFGCLVFACALVGCGDEDEGTSVTIEGSGVITTRTIEVGANQTFNVCCALDVTVTESSTPSLTVEGDDNIVSEIVVTESNGELKLAYQDNVSVSTRHTVSVVIGTATINGLTASGASRVSVRNTPDGGTFNLTASEASNVTIVGMNTASLDADVAGASTVELDGQATSQDLIVSGASVFRGYDLTGQDVSVVASGASTAQVHASMSLTGSASGASHISYDGNPTTVTVTTMDASTCTAR